MWKLRETLHGLRAWQFISQKLLRWLTLLPLLMILFSSAALSQFILFRSLFGVQVLFYGAGIIGSLLARNGRSAPRLLSIPLYVGVSAIGAFMGVIDAYVLRRRYDVWESPALSRGRAV